MYEIRRRFWTDDADQGGVGDNGAMEEGLQVFVDESGSGDVTSPFLVPTLVQEGEDYKEEIDDEHNTGRVELVRRVSSSTARWFLVTVHASEDSLVIGSSGLIKRATSWRKARLSA